MVIKLMTPAPIRKGHFEIAHPTLQNYCIELDLISTVYGDCSAHTQISRSLTDFKQQYRVHPNIQVLE